MFTDVGYNFTPKQSDKWENISTLNFKIRDCISDCFKVTKMILRVAVERGLIVFQVICLHLHTACFEGQKFISANPKYVFLYRLKAKEMFLEISFMIYHFENI